VWSIIHVRGQRGLLPSFDQYDHLAAIDAAARNNPALRVALGSDYLIKPDVVIARDPEEDSVINASSTIVDADCARLTSLRKLNNLKRILHASISCKWTIRSDRSQNSRSEALNLIRNRKGRLPHIVVVMAEPLPSRISSIALGTGDIDCVYHFALPELRESVREMRDEEAGNLLEMMVGGKRLRDISDLPLDLAV
jgi:hypothetical protein